MTDKTNDHLPTGLLLDIIKTNKKLFLFSSGFLRGMDNDKDILLSELPEPLASWGGKKTEGTAEPFGTGTPVYEIAPVLGDDGEVVGWFLVKKSQVDPHNALGDEAYRIMKDAVSTAFSAGQKCIVATMSVSMAANPSPELRERAWKTFSERARTLLRAEDLLVRATESLFFMCMPVADGKNIIPVLSRFAEKAFGAVSVNEGGQLKTEGRIGWSFSDPAAIETDHLPIAAKNMKIAIAETTMIHPGTDGKNPVEAAAVNGTISWLWLPIVAVSGGGPAIMAHPFVEMEPCDPAAFEGAMKSGIAKKIFLSAIVAAKALAHELSAKGTSCDIYIPAPKKGFMILADEQVAPARIIPTISEIELTAPETVNEISALSKKGVPSAIREFGSGPCGFKLLAIIKPAAIIMDKGKSIGTDQDSMAARWAASAAAKTFSCPAIMTGGDSPEAIDMARKAGLTAIAGTIVSPPIPANQAAAFILAIKKG